MKVRARNIIVFARWFKKASGIEYDYTMYFYHAMRWKYGKVDRMQLYHVCCAFDRSGIIPNFGKEYWNEKVLPFLLWRNP